MWGWLDRRFFRVYVIPGAVFQSVMIGGGYGTGREIVEYFTAYGFIGGLLGLLVAFLALGSILALTFELARRFRVRSAVQDSRARPMRGSRFQPSSSARCSACGASST